MFSSFKLVSQNFLFFNWLFFSWVLEQSFVFLINCPMIRDYISYWIFVFCVVSAISASRVFDLNTPFYHHMMRFIFRVWSSDCMFLLITSEFTLHWHHDPWDVQRSGSDVYGIFRKSSGHVWQRLFCHVFSRIWFSSKVLDLDAYVKIHLTSNFLGMRQWQFFVVLLKSHIAAIGV